MPGKGQTLTNANSLHLLKQYFIKYTEDTDEVVFCTKSGVSDHQLFDLSIDCQAEGLRNSVDNANNILGGEKCIDAFGPAEVDPRVPIETTSEVLAQLLEGKIGAIQLSEVSADTFRRASDVQKVDTVEAEISLSAMDFFWNGVAETCVGLSIAVLAHTLLGGGMLTGNIQKLEDMLASNHHKHFPRSKPRISRRICNLSRT